VWPLSVLFRGTVKHSKRVAKFNKEEELMEAFAEQMETSDQTMGQLSRMMMYISLSNFGHIQ